MDNNGKYIKHTIHISRRIHFVRNGEKYKMYKIDWCEGGMKLADIPCELLGIFTLVHVNKNFPDERSFHFCGSG